MQKSSRIPRRFLRRLLAWLGLAAGLVWLAWVLPGNLWSLRELKWRMGTQAAPGEAPLGHRRASLWQAQDALAKGEAQAARELLEAQAEKGDPLALSVYGRALSVLGEAEEAAQAWERAGDFNSLRAAGLAWAGEGRAAEAELAFQAAYRLKPDRIANAYADFLKETQGSEASEMFLRRVLERFPSNALAPQWSYRLGENLRRQGRLDEAEAVFLQGLEAAPKAYYLLTGLGWVYYDMGKREEAVKLFDEVTRGEIGQGYGYFAMGQLLAGEGRYLEADTWFAQAVSLEHGSRNWCMRRGHSARDGGLFPLAIQIYQECAERFPQDVEARFSLAWAYYQNQQTEQAVAAVDEALRLAPEPGVSNWLRAGQIFEAGGDAQGALAAFQKALVLDPTNAAALAGVKRLGGP